jgi:hypothetical protein
MSIIKFDGNICILSGKRGINQVYIDTIMVIELSRMLVGIDGSEESEGSRIRCFHSKPEQCRADRR